MPLTWASKCHCRYTPPLFVEELMKDHYREKILSNLIRKIINLRNNIPLKKNLRNNIFITIEVFKIILLGGGHKITTEMSNWFSNIGESVYGSTNVSVFGDHCHHFFHQIKAATFIWINVVTGHQFAWDSIFNASRYQHCPVSPFSHVKIITAYTVL